MNAGVDVTLTGGAVVAKVATGAALWYNPAGLAQFKSASFELTGVTLRMSAIRASGLLTLETGEQSNERRFDISFIPEAITFKLPLKTLQLGIGLFNSSLRRELAQQRVSHAGDPVAMTPPAQWNLGANTRVDNFHVTLVSRRPSTSASRRRSSVVPSTSWFRRQGSILWLRVCMTAAQRGWSRNPRSRTRRDSACS